VFAVVGAINALPSPAGSAASHPAHAAALRPWRISRLIGARHTVRISMDRATMPTVVPDHHGITAHGLAALQRALRLPSLAGNP
jgi:hypothetical protein